MSRQSRLWLLKRTGQLLLSGTRRVDFADFWLGDQYCSFVFTLSQLPLLVCSYANGFEGSLKKCGSSARFWPVMFLLATLPFFVRVVQSIKRYVDSGLSTHLVNGGKYLSGIVAYLVYFIWRHQGGHGASFVLWCVLNTIYAIYASSWDLLMDWSVLRMHAEHKLLRPELIYVHQIPLYYFAIISNVLIRFIWIIYIPTTGPSVYVRTFLAGTLEMLRRIQWNFYRLENEHLGNMDQYRITREVPLPYAFDDTPQEDVDDEDEDQIR
ncbi:EXS-domain-containing protein [Mycena floridula]|nr:EXS-domain-containing protein [Mycena floridula]